jgi:hypothetical protein
MVVIFQFTNPFSTVLKLNKTIILWQFLFMLVKFYLWHWEGEHVLQASECKDLRKMKLRERMKTGNEV